MIERACSVRVAQAAAQRPEYGVRYSTVNYAGMPALAVR
jgi:hypothetical protein